MHSLKASNMHTFKHSLKTPADKMYCHGDLVNDVCFVVSNRVKYCSFCISLLFRIDLQSLQEFGIKNKCMVNTKGKMNSLYQIQFIAPKAFKAILQQPGNCIINYRFTQKIRKRMLWNAIFIFTDSDKSSIYRILHISV